MATKISGELIADIGGGILRYGLVGILLYFGAFKFTPEEAAAIEPLVKNSPLMSWLYSILSLQGVSNLFGTFEILFALLIASRRFLPLASAVGSLGATGMFLTTLSFLFTTPGVWSSVPSFPFPVPAAAGGFLIKDVFLLGAAVYTCGEAYLASKERTGV
ncbi:MAG: YkgB family protein [Pyrinomonadaceae bacterium]